MHSFTESFALCIQFIFIFIYSYLYTYIYIRSRRIYGNHILLTKLLSRKKKISWRKSSTGSIDHHVRTSQTHEPIQSLSSSLNTIQPHIHALIHTNRMFWPTFLKLGGQQFVTHTVWNLIHLNATYYIYIYKSHIYMTWKSNRGCLEKRISLNPDSHGGADCKHEKLVWRHLAQRRWKARGIVRH